MQVKKIDININYGTFGPGKEYDGKRFSCTGELEERGEKTYIRYNEPSEHGGGRVLLTIDDGVVSLSRKGESVSNFKFEKGKTHLSRYFTPYGNFLTSVRTNTMLLYKTAGRGKVRLEYTLTVATDNLDSPSAEKIENLFRISYFE